MTRKVQWNSDALPYDQTLDQVLYEIRRSDAGESLLLDAVSAKDIIEDADGALAFDALVTPYAKLERKMEVLQGVMVRSGESVKPVAMQVTEPFKQRGVANVAAIFELSDGQTVSIFFHNPDVTPNKMAASDEVISWKWLLNKKDITIVVAPERGEDLNVREVARRIIRLAEKNSPAFQRANTKRAERMQGIQALKDEITTLETELATAQHELEVAKVAAETAPARTLLTDEEQAALAKREEAARAILEGMTDEQITQVGASPSLVTVVTMKLGRFSAIDKILENHPDDVEKAIASVVTEASAKSAQQKADITYRNSADGLFTSFFPDTPEGEKAWNIINATPGAEGGKVLAAHAEPTIEQLRKAGYTVEEDTSAPSAVDDDALLAELAQKSGEQDGSPDVFSVGSVKFQAFAVKIRQGKQRVWGIRVLENGKEMNPADGNGAGFKSDTKASMIEDMERSYAAITEIGDKAKGENRWREGFGLAPLPAEESSASNEQALIDAYIKAWGDEAAIVNAAVAAVNWEGITDNASATAEIQKLQSAANGERPIIKARDALEAAGMKTWDSRLSGVTETEEFQAQRKAMDAYREAMDKIQAIAKEKLIESGKAELSALPEDAPLEDAARAIYRKHGIDMGQRSDWVSRVVTAVNEKDAEALRSILAGVGSDSNKASMEIFERAAGFKLAKTQKERAKQIDEWAGITPEKRTEIEAAKDAAWQARKTEEGVKDAWGWLKSMKVRDGADVVDGQQYLLRQFAEGYDEAGTGKKGAATIYGMKNGSALRYVNNRSFNDFLKAAIAFGGLRQALELVGAVEPNAAEAQGDADKIAAVDAAYPFESATDGFKLWLHESLNEAGYSPFVTAKAMDEAVKRHGATVEWGKALAALDDVGHAVASLEASLAVVENNAPINRAEGDILQADLETDTAKSIREAIATLTEADYAPSEEDIGGTFEAEAVTLDSTNEPPVKALLASLRSFLGQQAALDAVPSLDGTEHVGTIKLAGEVIGRIDIADDGKAMVYVGAAGDARVVFPSGTRAMYSDDDAVLMVDALFSMRDAAAPVPAAGTGAVEAAGLNRPKSARKAAEFDARKAAEIEVGALGAQEAEAAGVPTQFTWPAHRKWVYSQAPRMTLREFQVALKGRHGMSGPEIEAYYKSSNGGAEVSAAKITTEGTANVPQASQAIQTSPQPAQAAAAPAVAGAVSAGGRGSQAAGLMQEKAVQSDGRITVDGYTYEMDTADGFMVTFVAPETVRGLKLWASEEDAINAKIQDAINLAKSSPYLTKRWNSKRGEVTHVALSHMPTMGAGSETYDVVYSDGSVMRIKGGDFDKTMQKEAYEATPEGAAAIAAERAQRDAAAAEAQSRREAAEKAAAARKQDLDSQIDDWLSKTSYTPVQKGSARAILSREAIYPEFDNAQLARVEFVQRVVDKGGKPNVEQVNRIKDKTRTQWNRMSNEEQREHERKVREGGKVPEYSLGNYIVTKTEYDYANFLIGKKSAPEPEVTPEQTTPAANPDRALFQSVIDGTVADILAPELADDLEAAYTRNQDDAELAALFEQAVTAYQAAMMAATSSLA